MPFSGFGDLDPGFGTGLQAFLAASGGRVWVTSGYRDSARQQQLWADALKKYGDPEVADNWVARPGTSNHEKRIATDLGFADDAARKWAHDNAGRFGLHFPMEWEPWHIEPQGSLLRADRGAYTTPPPGFANPWDAARDSGEDPHDPGVQMRRLFEVIQAGPEAAQGLVSSGPLSSVMASPEQPGSEEEPLPPSMSDVLLEP